MKSTLKSIALTADAWTASGTPICTKSWRGDQGSNVGTPKGEAAMGEASRPKIKLALSKLIDTKSTL